MNRKRLTMRKLKEVLRLKLECKLSNRAIANSVNISASTVSYYVRALEASHLSWPLPSGLSDQELIALLEPHCHQLKQKSYSQKQSPCFEEICKELKHKGVTLQILWQEYKARHQEKAYSYAEYCRQYRCWAKKLKPSMRQRHVAGEKCFVDYAGPSLDIYNPTTGEISKAKVFVATLGASNFTYVEATLTRSIPDWLGSHTRMLEYFGGVPKLIIPDNEKAGVSRASYYDPEKNPQYTAWANHYGTTILPARPGKPKDKAKVEAAVKYVEQAILAKLRHQKFFSIDQLNQAISKLLKVLNNTPFQKLPGTRESLFNEVEKSSLAPLPRHRYEYVEFKRVKVGLDYHICVDTHYYSVPYQHIHHTVEYRLSSNQLEVYYDGLRIASHLRQYKPGEKSTQNEHMPEAHRAHAQWTPDTFLQWAKAIGCAPAEIAAKLIKRQPHPECCYKIFLGCRNLVKLYGKTRFAASCRYALAGEAISYHSLKAILENKLEQEDITIIKDEADYTPSTHTNIRGADYYH